jgi:nucleotide-binding universal stress UspA family protein
MIRKVLLPVDFSPRDQAAAHYVKELHKKLAFDTTLLHVVPPPEYEAAVLEAGSAALQELLDTRMRLANEKLHKTCLNELQGLPVTRQLRSGFPSAEIVEYADEKAFDLIVMPTHGYGPFRRFLLGSVVSKVLHDARIPVMTGAHMEEPRLNDIHFDTVTASIDLSPTSSKVLDYAARLAKAIGAKLHIAHALAELGGHIGFQLPGKDELHFDKAARAKIGELCQSLDIPYEVSIESGDPGLTVNSLAKAKGSDLIVIGRSTASGMGRLRAHAYSIIRESVVPVISV